MKHVNMYLALVLTLFALSSTGFAQMKMECSCHSKNPSMKRMHETIGFNGCGNCHSKNENLMSARGKQDPNMKERLAGRIKTDKSCLPCHESDGTLKTGIHGGKSAGAISGTLYCPKDKLQFSLGTRACSRCGGKLLNMNEVMERSRLNPSNAICIECHTMPEVRSIERHSIFNNAKLQMCLDCHKGHDDCASCHH